MIRPSFWDVNVFFSRFQKLVFSIIVTLSICKSDDRDEIYERIDSKQEYENVDILEETLNIEIPNRVHTFSNLIDLCNIIKTHNQVVLPIS